MKAAAEALPSAAEAGRGAETTLVPDKSTGGALGCLTIQPATDYIDLDRGDD
jgi:hypothetical protein